METQSKYTVSVLSPEDFEWFTEVAAKRMLYEEVKRPEYYNLEQIKALALKGMMEETAIVAKCDGVPVGALGAILAPNTYNPNIKSLVEMFWYVLPEYRKTRVGYLLLDRFETIAEDIADEAFLTVLPTTELGRRAFEKRGWKFSEQVLHKRF